MTREAARIKVEQLDNYLSHTCQDYGERDHEAMMMAIQALEQEPKTGHWNDIPKYKDIAWQCSECGHFTTMKHNFCADCGCRMVDPQESEKQK